MTDRPPLTDRRALELHRQRASQRPEHFIHEDIAAEVEERLSEVNKSFTKPLLIGHVTPPFSRLFPDAPTTDDTETIQVEEAAHDLALHVFGLHWADDPVGQIVQSIRALEPDGLFLAVCFGGGTLRELRTSLSEAESSLRGGLSPRVAPMGEIRDLGALLQRAGAALPVADSRTIRVRYSSLDRLVRDLRGMGETNALFARDHATPPRQLFPTTERIYREHYSDEEGYLLATFEIIFLTGWAPSDSQPKPLRPGSANARLADALGTDEFETGDPAAPRLR